MTGKPIGHQLFQLPPDRFLAERKRLVDALRRAGDRAGAAAVDKLHRPSVCAWAVNQVAHREGRRMDALFEAGDALKRAHAQLQAGASADHLKQAEASERALVRELVGCTEAVLQGAGHAVTAGTSREIHDTFHGAALADDDVRALLRAGMLARPLAPLNGVEALLASGASARRGLPARPPTDTRALTRGRERMAELARALGQAEARLRRLEVKVKRAAEAAVARQARDDARNRVAELRAEQEAADAELRRLERGA
jgi:hypothetical protein